MVLLFTITTVISSCSSGSENQVSNKGNKANQPQGETNNPRPNRKTGGKPKNPEKVIAAKPEKPIQPVSGLIQPTDPQRRRQQVTRGRKDPFVPFAVEPKITTKVEPEPVEQPSSPLDSPPVFELPDPDSGPDIPQIILASDVLVTGIVEFNGVTQAILKAPNEKFSRYVQAGQYIANGQILVKRIETNQNAIPVVILEEAGVEVPREVGEKPQRTTAQNLPQATPTASLPKPPTPNPSNPEADGLPTALLPPPPPLYPN